MRDSNRNVILRILTNYLLSEILSNIRCVDSVVVHGSAARNEISLYSDQDQDLLLGNIGLTIITESHIKNVLPYFLLLKRLENLDKSPKLNIFLKKPLVLLKPFEITLIPRYKIKQIPPTISIFEMVEAHQILYGKDLLSLFNTKFNINEGFRMIINRLVGLNLCLPLIARFDYNSKLKVLAINYECTKGILGALEAFLVLLKRYAPSYKERANLIPIVENAFSDLFNDDIVDVHNIFTQAFRFKLNPNGLEKLHPVEYWLKARSLLVAALCAYKTKTIPLRDVFSLQHEKDYFSRFKDIFNFIINRTFDPRIFLIRMNHREEATKLIIECVFSFKPENCNKKSVMKNLILKSRYANYIYTYGLWHEITDHIKRINARA